jgi:hypothetical protein
MPGSHVAPRQMRSSAGTTAGARLGPRDVELDELLEYAWGGSLVETAAWATEQKRTAGRFWDRRSAADGATPGCRRRLAADSRRAYTAAPDGQSG